MIEHVRGQASDLTLRSLVAGLLLAFGVGAAGPYFTLYLQASNAGDVFYTSPVAHFLFFVLVGFVNVVVGAVYRPWAFRKGELVTIYIIMILANATHSIVSYWVPVLAAPFYYATPENDWVNKIHPFLSDWIVPHQLRGISAFFEGGHGESRGIAWEVWLRPLIG